MDLTTEQCASAKLLVCVIPTSLSRRVAMFENYDGWVGAIDTFARLRATREISPPALRSMWHSQGLDVYLSTKVWGRCHSENKCLTGLLFVRFAAAESMREGSNK
jgi:hypothetical protein